MTYLKKIRILAPQQRKIQSLSMMAVAVEQHRRDNDGVARGVYHKAVCAIFLADVAYSASEVGLIAHTVLPGE